MAAPNGFTGTVVSGSGSTYSVSIVGVGTVSVSVPQIDAAETIPAGKKILVVKEGSVYRSVVPVWL